MPIISLLLITVGIALYVIDALLKPRRPDARTAPSVLVSWGLAATNLGFALIFLLDDVHLVHF